MNPRRRSSVPGVANATSKVQALIGDASANYIPPYIHLSMLVHPDGIALYAKMQTDPFFKESLTSVLGRAGGAAAAATATHSSIAEFFENATSLRAQLASNRAVVDVARAAYQHPTTAPVLRFQMPYGATMESVASEGIAHFKELLIEQGHLSRESAEDDHVEDLIPATNPEDLEIYVYHIEDPDLNKQQAAMLVNDDAALQAAAAASGGSRAAILAAREQQARRKSSSAANATTMIGLSNNVMASSIGAASSSSSSSVQHRAIPIGDYDRLPPLEPEIPIRIQLNLFQLIAAARKRRRKFIVRSGLHPSAVEECSPLNVYAVLTVGPFWLERRALEIQEEAARDLVAKNEGRYMMAIHEAHAVSYNRATKRAKGHRQLRHFHGEIEGFFLRLALRNAMVKQASMRVHDVVERHMRTWPEAMKVREASFQEELKKRRCVLADYAQKLKLQLRIAEVSAAGL